MLWYGVEYFERRSKLDLKNIDDIVLRQQEESFSVDQLKDKNKRYAKARKGKGRRGLQKDDLIYQFV